MVEHVSWNDILSGLGALVGIVSAIILLAVAYLRSFVRGELQASQESILKSVSTSFRESEDKREQSFEKMGKGQKEMVGEIDIKLERMGQSQKDMIRDIDIKLEKYTLKEVLSAMIEPIVRRVRKLENGGRED